MIIHVTRHGETDYNVQKRYTGSTDIPLNATGIRQAEQLALSLIPIKFDMIVSSPLQRARQTASIVQASFGVPTVVMDEFSEINAGVYEGLTREEAQTAYPELWARLAPRSPDDAPTGGETHRQFDARIANGLAKLKSSYGDRSVLLICHAFTARVINRQLTGLSFEDMHSFSLGNCEIAKYSL